MNTHEIPDELRLPLERPFPEAMVIYAARFCVFGITLFIAGIPLVLVLFGTIPKVILISILFVLSILFLLYRNEPSLLRSRRFLVRSIRITTLKIRLRQEPSERVGGEAKQPYSRLTGRT